MMDLKGIVTAREGMPRTDDKHRTFLWNEPRVIWIGAGLLLIVIFALGRVNDEPARGVAHEAAQHVRVKAETMLTTDEAPVQQPAPR